MFASAPCGFPPMLPRYQATSSWHPGNGRNLPNNLHRTSGLKPQYEPRKVHEATVQRRSTTDSDDAPAGLRADFLPPPILTFYHQGAFITPILPIIAHWEDAQQKCAFSSSHCTCQFVFYSSASSYPTPPSRRCFSRRHRPLISTMRCPDSATDGSQGRPCRSRGRI